MRQFTKIESQFFKLSQNEIPLEEFEHWVYSSEWLEEELGNEDYLALISLNYKHTASKYEAIKILERHIDRGKYEQKRIIKLLDSIIQRDGNEAGSLMECYDLYCDGYRFFEGLGLWAGLFLVAPPAGYNAEQWEDLSDIQKARLLDSLYPAAKERAEELKAALENGAIILTGKRSGEFNRWEYIDNRGPKGH